MAEVVKGMRNWLSYSTMDEDEWDTTRKVLIEEEVRRLFGSCADIFQSVAGSSELGQVSVPVRTGAFRRLKHISGKVFLSKDEYSDGERFVVHLMVSAGSVHGQEEWEPVCDWCFDSVSEVADFVEPPSAESAS